MSDITTLLNTGGSAHRVDLVFVAEGYQSSERDKFLSDAAGFMDYMLGSSNSGLNAPFSSYRGYFNASALFVASAQSGTDQPNAGISVDTAFDSSQHLADGRLVYGDTNKVQAVVNQAYASNAHDMTVVLVNSETYGGAGTGTIAWATTGDRSSAEILLHEIGHSFASLQDEYADPAIVDSFPLSGLRSVHVTSSLNNIPWSAWLGYTDSLGAVDVYEGGYYRSTGVWRATLDSKMNHLGVAFSAPEKEAFVLAYYRAIGDYLDVGMSIPGLYRAIVPDAGMLAYAWKVNGSAVSNIDGVYFDAYGRGVYTNGVGIGLTTTDNTGYVRTGLAQTQQTEIINVTNATVTDVTSQAFAVTQADTILRLGALNNQISLGTGAINDYIDGGAGVDTLRLNTTAAGYQLQELTTDTTLLMQRAVPVLALAHLERLEFTDRKLAIDLGGAAGNTVKIIGAAFGAPAIQQHPEYVRIGLDLFDANTDILQVCMLAIGAMGNPNNETFVNTVYKNVVGVLPTQGIRDLYVAMLAGSGGTMTQAQLLDFAANTDANELSINLVGLHQSGVEFV
jgi:hypothetical protein